MWSLSPKNNLPLYQQIIALIEHYLANGKLLPSAKLPAERQLAALLKVNRSTVVRALNELTERGVLIRKTGSGTFVNSDKWGVKAKPLINWHHYVDQGNFATAAPYIRHTDEVVRHTTTPILDFANGELPLSLSPNMAMPSYSWQELLGQQQKEDHTGYLPLKQAILNQLQLEQDLTALPEQILITSGAQQALFLITQCLLRPGDTIAIECPSYFYALPLFQSAGLRIIPLPMDNDGVIPTELLRLHHKFKVKMIFLNPTLQNPTGITMSLARRHQLIEICASLQLPIVEDNSYGQLHFTPVEQPPSLKKLDKQNVLYIGSLSKVIGSMTRIGWLIGPAAVIKRLAEARQEMDFGLSIFPQVLAHHVINHADYHQHLVRLRQVLAHQCQLLMAALRPFSPHKFTFIQPQGGFHLWCQLPEKSHSNRIASALLANHILVMPAPIFGSTRQAIRLTFTRVTKETAVFFAQQLTSLLI